MPEWFCSAWKFVLSVSHVTATWMDAMVRKKDLDYMIIFEPSIKEYDFKQVSYTKHMYLKHFGGGLPAQLFRRACRPINK